MTRRRDATRAWAWLLVPLILGAGCVDLVETDWKVRSRVPPLPDRSPRDPHADPTSVAQPGDTLALTLDDCVRLALANHPAMRKAEEEGEKAKGARLQALSALLPRLSAELGYTRVDEVTRFSTTDASGTPVDLELGALDNYRAGVTLRQPLFLGGRGVHGLTLAGLASDRARTVVGDVKRRLAFRVRTAYVDALFARATLAAHEATAEAAAEHLVSVKARFAEGLASSFEVLRAEVSASNAGASVDRAKRDLDDADLVLHRLLGVPGHVTVTPADPLDLAPSAEDQAASIRRALDSRPDLRGARVEVDMESRRVQMAVGSLLPSAWAFVSGGWEKPSSKDFAGREGDTAWTAGLVVEVPLFDGFEGMGRVRSTSATLRQARWDLEDRRREVVLEVRRAFTALGNAEAMARTQERNVGLAEESLRLARSAFEAGAGTTLDVQDARTALATARLGHLEAVRARRMARFALRFAEGVDEFGEVGP